MADKVKEEVESAEDGNPQEIPYAANMLNQIEPAAKVVKKALQRVLCEWLSDTPVAFSMGIKKIGIILIVSGSEPRKMT
uniref:Uncharacterized protein n=1 Tax=Ditylenchus dipsaci TaxID=166011 RepID=A0A915DVZ4_9BILA